MTWLEANPFHWLVRRFAGRADPFREDLLALEADDLADTVPYITTPSEDFERGYRAAERQIADERGLRLVTHRRDEARRLGMTRTFLRQLVSAIDSGTDADIALTMAVAQNWLAEEDAHQRAEEGGCLLA